jgi:hypothetical protein
MAKLLARSKTFSFGQKDKQHAGPQPYTPMFTYLP